MNKKRTIFTAMILGGAVGLAPMTAWSQEAPQETRQPYPELTRPGENEGIPGMHGGGTQELSDNDMEAVEQALEEKGYDVGKVDGRADNVSRAAIRAFQKDEGIPITGMIDEKTADRVGFKEAHKTRPGDVTGETDRSAPLEQRSYR